MVEPYILNKIDALTEQDLLMALIGFNNKHLTQTHDLRDILEGTLMS